MIHPFERLGISGFRKLYAAAWLATILIGMVLQHFGGIYMAQQGPNGETYDVIAFEFAATPERMATIFAVWGEVGKDAAVKQTLIDYFFPLAYSTLIAASIVALLGAGLSARWVAVGRLLAWAQWKAAALDAIENTALLAALVGEPLSPFPQIAAGAAAVKFLLIAVGVVYIFAALPLLHRPSGGADGR